MPTPVYSNQSSDVMSLEDQQVIVYPNPASDLIHIRVKNGGSEEIDIQIVNIPGQVDQQSSGIYSGKGEEIPINVSHLEPGIYLLKVNTAGTASLHRIIISR